MRVQRGLLAAIVMVLLMSVPAAADFDWTKDFNARAEADPAGFRTRLSVRFNIDEPAVSSLMRSVPVPADAYIVLRLGEMSKKTTDSVIEQYRSDRAKGWGVIAKSLGIKPGSKEFQALKRGSDLYDDGKAKAKARGKGKGE